MNNNKPWDARLAYRLIYPLRNSSLAPNHFTFLRLVFGVLACAGLSVGNYFWANIGAACFVLSNFLDHTDGEFARLTGKTTRFGHYLDIASDAIVNILLFIGIGIGLRASNLDIYSIPMGIVSGIAVAGIFHMRLYIEESIGKEQARQPNVGTFEAEDILYLLPVITLFNQLVPFLVLASIGAPLFCLWVLREFLALKQEQRT